MKKLAALLPLLVFLGKALAQPLPCGPLPAMTTTCAPACVICDINGFTGINNSNVQGQAPPGFCTTQVHHMQWIAFIAGSTDLTITVKPTNCQNNEGLEIGIYKSLDCLSFELVSNCDTDVQPGETGVFKNTVPLIIGQYYYFVMDGSNDDICEYTINVTNGTTAVGALPPPPPIAGSQVPCQGGTFNYSIPVVAGATLYVWSVDGILKDTTSAPSIDLEWPTAGQHTVCVHAANVCDEGQPTCLDVLVAPLPPTVLEEHICLGDTFFYENKAMTATGQYTFPLTGQFGCDSTVIIDLDVSAPAVEEISVTICTVDSFEVAGQFFKTEGKYFVPTSATNGCDSLVVLNLNTEICPIHGTAKGDVLDCSNSTDGEISIKMDDGTGPYTLEWENVVGGQPSGTSSIAASAGFGKLTGLPAGIYNITITDLAGKVGYLNAFVTAPPALDADVDAPLFGFFEISCPGLSDGKISVKGKGGTPPYSINWSTGATTFAIDSLPAGDYFFTITDSKGCTFIATQKLAEPQPLDFSLRKDDPGCPPAEDGELSAENATGGQSPYLYALDGGIFQQNPGFAGLAPGSHRISIKDSFGCTDSLSATLAPPPYIPLDMGGPYSIELGDSIKLSPVAGISPTIWNWGPAGRGLSCLDCPGPWAAPVNDQFFTLTVDSPNGCPVSDSVKVSVVKIRRIFIPNAFSPDDDGQNDYLTVFAGRGTREVKKLQVWSRWGELLFEKKNFQPNDPTLGWDGSFRGKKMMPGAYPVVAEVEFIDGHIEELKGDVTIVR